eukprot:scaffold43737_cov44-Attheya_sp.AAC.1
MRAPARVESANDKEKGSKREETHCFLPDMLKSQCKLVRDFVGRPLSSTFSRRVKHLILNTPEECLNEDRIRKKVKKSHPKRGRRSWSHASKEIKLPWCVASISVFIFSITGIGSGLFRNVRGGPFVVKEEDLQDDPDAEQDIDVKIGQTNNNLQDDPDAEQDIDVEIGQTNSAGDQSLASQNASGSLVLTCGRSIPNCCAVCLSAYEVDDNVVWSCNPMCQHAFHQECVLEWLIKMQDGTPCPCCRQEFTDLASQEETPKDVEGSSVRSFNLAAVSF